MPATYEALSQGGHEAMATEIFAKIKDYLDTHGADSKVSKAGDTMTGNLIFNGSAGVSYEGTHNTIQMIKFIDNTVDANGNGIAIGGGGQTIIGGGESSNVMKNEAGTAGAETMWIGNDGNVNILTNLQNGWADRKNFVFNTGGRFTAPGEIWSETLAPQFTGRCTDVDLTLANNGGTSRNCWFRIYDKNSKYSFYAGSVINSSGSVGAYMVARNYKTGTTTNVDNSLALLVNKDGTRSVSVSDGAIWRSAIGAMRNLSYAKREVTLSSGKAMIDLGATYGSTHFVVCATGYFKTDASTVIDVGIQDGRYLRCHQNTASGGNNVAVICYWYY